MTLFVMKLSKSNGKTNARKTDLRETNLEQIQDGAVRGEDAAMSASSNAATNVTVDRKMNTQLAGLQSAEYGPNTNLNPPMESIGEEREEEEEEEEEEE